MSSAQPPSACATWAADTSHDLHDDAALRSIYRTGPSDTSLAKLPSPGTILECLSPDPIDGAVYDAALPARQDATLY